jgi:hypothetical protein
MLGSAFFMVSAVAAFVLPSTAEMFGPEVSVAGTFLGALCFLAGAGLMITAWRSAVGTSRRARHASGPPIDRAAA